MTLIERTTGRARPRPDSQGRVPFRLRIGVSGHREIAAADRPAIEARVDEVLARLRTLMPARPHTEVVFTAVSAVAEGADRIVADRVLAENASSSLEVVLPLHPDEYIKDFDDPKHPEKSAASVAEFQTFLTDYPAVPVYESLPEGWSRDEAYELGGHYVAEHCDALITIWDGKPAAGRGGTGEIVPYAAADKVPIFWVRRDGSAVSELWGLNADGTVANLRPREMDAFREGLGSDVLHQLEQYNSFEMGKAAFDKEMAKQRGYLIPEKLAQAVSDLQPELFTDWLLPYFVRADVQALDNKKWQYNFLAMVSIAAAIAVVLAGVQTAFQVAAGLTSSLEVLVLGSMICVYAYVKLRGFNEHFTWSRFLAERCREALYVAIAGCGSGVGGPSRIYLRRSPGEWAHRAFAEAWAVRPERNLDESNVPSLKRLLDEAWISDQRGWHARRSHDNEHWFALFSNTSLVLFFITFLVALAHALNLFHHTVVEGLPLVGDLHVLELIVFLSVALPGGAAALTSIAEQREFHRNGQRYDQIARYLDQLQKKLAAARRLRTVRAIADDAETVLVQEVNVWLAIMGFHDVHLH